MACSSVTPPRITRADVLAMRPSFRELAGIVIRIGPRVSWAERAKLLRLASAIVRIRVQLLLLVWV
jgi:hypothetical protein